MKINIMTLFPEMCEAVLSESIIGRAREKGLVEINCINIRDYTEDKHRRVDDAPYGGGMGMLMQTVPIANCYKAICEKSDNKNHLIYMSPKGKTFNQQRAVELSKLDRVVLLCGHYEGIDQRVIDEIVDEELSIGDYVLTGGELPALTVADAVCRMLPGVLSDDICFEEESHFGGLLEYPQYTKPAIWNGREVPEVLLSGNHAKINDWRKIQSILITLQKRPDMLKPSDLTEKDIKLLKKNGISLDGKNQL